METNKKTLSAYLVASILNKIILGVALYLCIGELNGAGWSTRLALMLVLLIVLYLIDIFRFKHIEENK